MDIVISIKDFENNEERIFKMPSNALVSVCKSRDEKSNKLDYVEIVCDYTEGIEEYTRTIGEIDV